MFNKINRKLKIVFFICLILSLFSATLIFNLMKSSVVPEEKIEVPVFSKDLAKDAEIIKSDIKMIQVQPSIVPASALKNTADILGKTLLEDVYQGEYAFPDKLSERGVAKINIDNMYVCGIDIENISDYLGVQIKVGDVFTVYEKLPGVLPRRISDVTIVSIVDANANELSAAGNSNPKTINIAVNSESEMIEILVAEENRAIELVRPPLKKESETASLKNPYPSIYEITDQYRLIE